MKNIIQIFVLLALLTGCATLEKEPLNSHSPQSEVSKFSEMAAEENLQSVETPKKLKGWYPWALTPNKTKTTYKLDNHNGKTVIHADADSSASGLMINLKPRSVSGSSLHWEWKALGLVPGADNTQSAKDDAPLRIMLAFDGDKKKLSLKDQMAFELATLISGHEMPYATLMYVWASNHSIEEVIANKYTTRLKIIVVDSGDQYLGQWRNHQRDIEADYEKVFQEKPGRLIGMGILTDTDNTKTQVKAIYGDIEIKRGKI